MHKPPASHEQFLNQRYEIAGRIIDPLIGTLNWQGETRHLRRKQLLVLAILANAGGAFVARQGLIDQDWDGNALVGDVGVTDTISALRRSLDDSDRSQPLIRTIPRGGYLLAVPVRLLDVAPPTFAAGAEIPGKRNWFFVRALSESEGSQTWLAQASGMELRVFRFCRNEKYLRLLQREITLLRYLREALAGRADIAGILDWQLDEPPYFLELGYTAHGNLVDYAGSVGGLSQVALTDRRRWITEIATALAAVHTANIVHRNISSASVFLAADSNRICAKLGEFGLGELTDRSRLEALKITALGLTLAGNEITSGQIYLAPERLTGQAATTASDVYALGVLLYQLSICDLTRAPGAAWEANIACAPLQALIAACTSAEPDQRPSAQAVSEQLQALDAVSASEKPEQAALSPSAGAIPDIHSTRSIATMLGQTVGPYRLMEKLGEGGMGTVYLAEQRAPVQRQVAVKLVKAGMDTAEVLARFEAERQALALMNHVNVAAVYEAGAAQSGRPYFAMEYVPGLEITAHCDARDLDFRARIEFFLQVSNGVLHAHQKGIIHRDLKPSNILIKTVQGQPATAKIIDFGVAKSLQRKLGDLTAYTQLGSFVGTRMYSSPEQISGNASAIDTRCDIYSLGVVLYELLTGVAPYSDEALASKSPVDMSRVLSHKDPPTLLARFVSLNAQQEADIAARRRMTVAQMKQALGSDLSWIVAKCIERDPDARYASVLELEKDLRRWLENRPVEARAITWTYRMRKMVRRNLPAVALGGAVSLALVVTTTAAVFGFVRAERALEQTKLAAAFQQKQIEQIDLNGMARGLRIDLSQALQELQTADASFKHLSETQKALASVDFVDLARKRMEQNYLQPALQQAQQDFSDEPELMAGLLQSVAISARELGSLSIAWQAQQESLKLHTRLFGEQGAASLNSLYQRGLQYQAEGKYGLAKKDIGMAYAGFTKALGSSHSDTLKVALALVEVQNELLDPVELDFARQAFLDHQATFGAGDVRTIQAQRLLGETLTLAGRHEEADLELQAALSATKALNGAESRTTAQANGALADNYLSQRKFVLAVPYLESSARAYATALGKTHIQTLNASNYLAFGYYYIGRLDDARKLLLQTIDSLTSAYGSDYFGVANAMYLLAMVDISQGEVKKALAILQTSYERMHRSGNENEYVYKWLFVGGMAEALTTLGQFDQAERLIRERLANDQMPSGYVGRMEAQRALAMIQIARGQTNEAVANMNSMLRSVEENSPKDHSRIDLIRSSLGEALYANGELAKARTLLEGVLSRQNSGNSGKPNDLPMTRARFAAVLLAQGQAPEALVMITEAVQAARAFMHPHNPQLAWLLAIESQVLLANGTPQEALASFREAAQIIEGSGLGEYYVMQLRPSCEALQRADLLADSLVDACR